MPAALWDTSAGDGSIQCVVCDRVVPDGVRFITFWKEVVWPVDNEAFPNRIRTYVEQVHVDIDCFNTAHTRSQED